MSWDDPLDPVAITVQEVIDRKSNVLLVIHDKGHGGWQFMDGADVTGRKPVVILKDELLTLDPSLKQVTDLPVGWRAERKNVKDQWTRKRSPAEKQD